MAARKIALVTGGGAGIGRAAAVALLADGWRVALAGRSRSRLEEAARDIDAGGADTLCVAADVGDPASVRTLFAAVAERFGRLDLLFNNAGTSAPAVPIEDISHELWQAVLAVNLTGAFLCTQEAVRMMKAQSPQGGRIVNNGSVSAHVPRPMSAPYTATKHAITGLTRATALDGRPFRIACGQIDIGNAATDMTERMASGILQADGRMAPEPRMDVADAGRAVAYMASLPLEANVLFMTVMATSMPFVGRG